MTVYYYIKEGKPVEQVCPAAWDNKGQPCPREGEKITLSFEDYSVHRYKVVSVEHNHEHSKRGKIRASITLTLLHLNEVLPGKNRD